MTAAVAEPAKTVPAIKVPQVLERSTVVIEVLCARRKGADDQDADTVSILSIHNALSPPG